MAYKANPRQSPLPLVTGDEGAASGEARMRKGWSWPGSRRLLAALVLLAIAAGRPALAADRAPDLVLKGQIAGADNETYRRVPFDVPAGTKRLTVVFSYTGKADHTVIDMGLWDGTRFRGWSGGARDRFTLSAEDATPGYLPGLLPAGKWTLMLGLPNIRKASHASFEARVFFDRTTMVDASTDAPLSDKPGWYRGDLHMHTAHSDATCAGQDGVRAPCPVYRTVEAAAVRGLDFIAITDHNGISQYDAERELQPAFSRLLLIPGREITTFKGHANVFGPTAFIDFRLGDKQVPDMKALEAAATASGGLFSVNHPSIPYGEQCMGCGWIAADTDWRHVQAIEIVNGGVLAYSDAGDGVFSGMPFWQARLNAGYRITGIGGSDNHDAGIDPKKPAAVGRPTTVVYAARPVATPAILDGIRSGRGVRRHRRNPRPHAGHLGDGWGQDGRDGRRDHGAQGGDRPSQRPGGERRAVSQTWSRMASRSPWTRAAAWTGPATAPATGSVPAAATPRPVSS